MKHHWTSTNLGDTARENFPLIAARYHKELPLASARLPGGVLWWCRAPCRLGTRVARAIRYRDHRSVHLLLYIDSVDAPSQRTESTSMTSRIPAHRDREEV